MISRFKKNFSRVSNAWIPRQSKRIVDGKAKGPNATEAKYLREILEPMCSDMRHTLTYEPTPIILTATTRREYTADFLVEGAEIIPTYHEVKGSYHLPTHERARLAWEIAAETHPEYDFVWAELTRRGWEIERWECGGERILVHYAEWPIGEWMQAEPDWRRHKPRKCSTWKGKTRK